MTLQEKLRLPSGVQLVELIARSPRMPLRDKDALLLNQMTAFDFGIGGNRKGWSIGCGPQVVLVHGWGGLGVQMAPIALSLVKKGFQCTLFDAGGHGQSADAAIGFDTFINDVTSLAETLGNKIHALIGHSAGGLGMMAARHLRGVQADRFVCLAVPFYPYVPLETLKSRYQLPDAALDRAKPVLARQFETPWCDLECGAAFGGNRHEKLMLIYDYSDERVRHEDANHIAAIWRDATIVKTTALGHNRILSDTGVLSKITTWLTNNQLEGAL